MNRQLLGLFLLVAICSFALGYLEGLRAGGKYVIAITECGSDRECIEAAGGDPSVILDH